MRLVDVEQVVELHRVDVDAQRAVAVGAEVTVDGGLRDNSGHGHLAESRVQAVHQRTRGDAVEVEVDGADGHAAREPEAQAGRVAVSDMYVEGGDARSVHGAVHGGQRDGVGDGQRAVDGD